MRVPTKEETEILEALIQKSGLDLSIDGLLVSNINDGEMGSLILGLKHDSRGFGSCVSELEIKDIDGVPVLYSLYIDKAGRLYELDVFKSDFSPNKYLKGHS